MLDGLLNTSHKLYIPAILHFFAYLNAVGLVFQKLWTVGAYVKVVKCGVSH